MTGTITLRRERDQRADAMPGLSGAPEPATLYRPREYSGLMTDRDRAAGFLRSRRQELADDGASIPLQYDELQRAAEEQLAVGPYAYTAGGAGTESTMRANREGFDRYRIVPRVLRDVSAVELSGELFGQTLPAPVGLAPVGSQRMYHPEGELATARAAAELGVPFALSTWSSTPIEAVAEAMGEAPRMFQLYWVGDWEVSASFARRAEQAGYDAILLTLDAQLPPWMPKPLATGYSTDDDAPKANFLSDPVVAETLGIDPDRWVASDEEAARAVKASYSTDASLTWGDLDFLREQVDLPIVLKGILHPDDAARAVGEGVDGVIVSSHGGRRLDGAISAIEALPSVVEAVDGEVPVLLDSGVRGGADAFKALALGATAVFVGRPYVFGLSVAGQRGVYEAVANVLAELESVVGSAGFGSVGDVGPDAVVARER